MGSKSKTRARDLGLNFDGVTGEFNAITDVPGLEVGYCTIKKGSGELRVGEGPVLTGVTAILPRGKQSRLQPVWAGQFDLNGNGEMTGTHWINDAGYFMSPVCLTNTHSVGMVHHACVKWMVNQYPYDFQEHHSWAMPVVAETYDGLTNDINGQHVREEHVLEALNNAQSGLAEEGNAGGGAGMQTYEFKGGTGTSSRRLSIGSKNYTVASLVQSNFGTRHELMVRGVPVGRHITENAIISDLAGHEQGSIIVIIATDIPMLPVQLKRLAKRGALGIGRTGSSGGHYSGDLILAFSTANETDIEPLGVEQADSFQLECVNDDHCDSIYEAAVQAIEEAILNAMIAAESVSTVKPAGFTLKAIDHEELLSVMRRYQRN